MRKTDKKRENQIRASLTDVCEAALAAYAGFEWLTHLVDYDHFPKSLKVICVFDTNDCLKDFTAENGPDNLRRLIQERLFQINVDIQSSQITFDTEENCTHSDKGNWALRLAK